MLFIYISKIKVFVFDALSIVQDYDTATKRREVNALIMKQDI